MRVSAREAARMLADAGLTRPQVRRLLAAGLAGAAEQAGGMLLYEAARVEALRTAPDVVLPEGGGPTLVARMGHGRGWHLTHSPEDQRARVSGPWRATALQRLEVRLSVQDAAAGRAGPVLFLATVSGYVVLGAEVVGAAVAGEQTFFELTVGDWSGDAVGTRCPTGPGASWRWFDTAQLTPSRSTTKISVSPGLMTPPAPRSP